MVGDWEIHEKLGDGGMGIVYRASHILISGDFALKMLRPELSRDTTVVNRFLAEVKKARLLDHPNIVRMELPFRAGDSIYLPMELLHGSNLGQLLDEEAEPWPVDRTLEIIYQAAAGLGHAHSRSVLHRDIKPENIFVTSTGRVKLLDFGLAKKLGDQSLTAEGMAVGTPVYMAPEILQGNKPIAASDMYALGMIMFRMLTGRLPIPVQDTAATIAEIFGPVLHAHEEGLPRPSAFRPGLPEWLDTLSAQLLDTNPDSRPANGAELAKFLENHRVRSDGTVSQDLPTLIPRGTSAEHYVQTPPFNQTMSPVSVPYHSSPTHEVQTADNVMNYKIMATMAALILVTAVCTWLITSTGQESSASVKPKAASTATTMGINFSTEPDGAKVYVAGKLVCNATPCSGPTPLGRQLVRFEKAKYETITKEVSLTKESPGIHVKLKATFGLLSIVTQPAGLNVIVNGKTWGQSPIMQREVPAGTHVIQTNSKTHYTQRTQLVLGGGESRTLQLMGRLRSKKKSDPKYDDFFELDVPKKPSAKKNDPSFDLEP